MKRISRLMAPVLIVAMFVGALMAQDRAKDAPKAPKPRSDGIAEQWRFPGALEAGIVSHPTNPTLQLEDYVVQQPFGKVWEFYSQKCGHEKPFPGDGGYQVHGKNREGGLYIIHDRFRSGRRWAYFAYNTDHFTVAVTIIPVPEGPEATSIAVTVGVP